MSYVPVEKYQNFKTWDKPLVTRISFAVLGIQGVEQAELAQKHLTNYITWKNKNEEAMLATISGGMTPEEFRDKYDLLDINMPSAEYVETMLSSALFMKGIFDKLNITDEEQIRNLCLSFHE